MENSTRREDGLNEWQDALSTKELKLESGEDNICGLMRELRIKDMLIADKEIELKKKDRELEDNRRQCQEDVRREVEVCCCVLC